MPTADVFIDDVVLFDGEPCASPGKIMDAFLDDAQARNTLDFLTWTFTDTLDSDGNAWDDDCLSITIRHGTTYKQILDRLVAFGYDWEITPDWELKLYNRRGSDVSNDVRILSGRDITSDGSTLRRSVAGATSVLAEGGDGYLEDDEEDASHIAAVGRRELFVVSRTASTSTTIQAIATNVLADQQIAGSTLRVEIVPSDGRKPHIDFAVGDDIGVYIPGALEGTFRVMRIASRFDQNGTVAYVVDLNSIAFESIAAVGAELQRLLASAGIDMALGGGSIEGGGATSGVSAQSSPTGQQIITVPVADHTHELDGDEITNKHAGGDLTGDLPNPTVNRIQGVTVEVPDRSAMTEADKYGLVYDPDYDLLRYQDIRDAYLITGSPIDQVAGAGDSGKALLYDATDDEWELRHVTSEDLRSILSDTDEPAVSGDDGQKEGFYFQSNAEYLFIWTNGSVDSIPFIRFPSVAIAKDTTVYRARLRLYGDDPFGAASSGNQFYFDAYNADDPSAPTSVTEVETAAAGATGNPSPTYNTDDDYTQGAWNEYDVSDAVQTILQRSGWASGQAMLLLGIPTGTWSGSNGPAWETYDNPSGNAPQLIIEVFDTYITTDADAIHDNVAGEIHAVTAKGTPVGADELLLEDSADSWAKKRVTLSSLPAGTDDAAIHDDTAGEIAAVTEKASPVSADLILIEDSEAANAKKRVQVGNLPGGSGTDADAIHDNVAGEIHAITSKATPVAADEIVLEDSADSWNKKRATISSLPTGDDANAIHDDESGEIAALTEKTTPVSADLLIIEDSAASNVKKKVQVGNLPGGGLQILASGTDSFTATAATTYERTVTFTELSVAASANLAVIMRCGEGGEAKGNDHPSYGDNWYVRDQWLGIGTGKTYPDRIHYVIEKDGSSTGYTVYVYWMVLG